MARTTLQLIERVAEIIDPRLFVNDTFNSSGGSTTTGVDDALKKYGDNSFNTRHLYIDGGTPTLRELVITDSVESTGTVTFKPAIGAAPNSLTYLILPYSRTAIVAALKGALTEMYEDYDLRRQFQYHGIIGGSAIYNGAFEYWDTTSTVDGWTVDTATLARANPTSNVQVLATRSGIALTTAAGSLKLDDEFQRWLVDAGAGGQIRVKALVQTAVGSNIRLRLDIGATPTQTASGYHSGTEGWEIVDTGLVSVSEGDDVELFILNDTTTAGYVQRVWSEFPSGPKVRDYPWPVDYAPRILKVEEARAPIVSGDTTLESQVQSAGLREIDDWELHTYTDIGGADGTLSGRRLGSLHFPEETPRAGHRLVITCEGPISEPSGDTDNIEVDKLQADAVAYLASAILLEGDMRNRSRMARDQMETDAINYREAADSLMSNRSQVGRGRRTLARTW